MSISEERVDCVTVATHNLMRGIFLDDLAHYYRMLSETRGLDILCLQENIREGRGIPSVTIAQMLGPHFEIVSSGSSDCAILFDRRRLRYHGSFAVALPVLKRFSFFERFWSTEAHPFPHATLVAAFTRPDSEPFTVVNLHLDAQGNTPHRRSQAEALARVLQQKKLEDRLILCGDTNARAHPRRRQLGDLGRTLSPFADFGVAGGGMEPTHFLGRMREPRASHRLFRLMGKLGYDRVFPQRLDILLANMPIIRERKMSVPFSDHDLLWATVDVA